MRKQNGFTLVELLVVVSIIGILATVVIMNVSGARAKAQNTKIKADMSTVFKAIDTHLAYYGALPTGLNSAINKIDPDLSKFKDDTGVSLLTTVPQHPLNGSGCTTTFTGGKTSGEGTKTYCSIYYSSFKMYIIIYYTVPVNNGSPIQKTCRYMGTSKATGTCLLNW